MTGDWADTAANKIWQVMEVLGAEVCAEIGDIKITDIFLDFMRLVSN